MGVSMFKKLTEDVYLYLYEFALKRDSDDPHTSVYGISMILLSVYAVATLIIMQIAGDFVFGLNLIELFPEHEKSIVFVLIVAIFGLPRVIFGSRSGREKMVLLYSQARSDKKVARAIAFGCYPLLLFSLLLLATYL